LGRLEEALLRRRAAFLIAGAGYGKSTAIRQLLPAHPELRVLRASRHDATPERLLHAILANFGVAQTESRTRRALELLGPREAAARHLSALPAGAVIAIDDLQEFADAPECLRLIEDMIESGPEGVRFVLASRTSPPYRLVEWIARGIAGAPVEAAELSFNLAEIDALLDRGENRILAARRVFDATAGWPIAVALACAGKIPLSGGKRAIDTIVQDYLERVVLAELSAGEQDVLRIACFQPSTPLEVLDGVYGSDANASAQSLTAKLPQLARLHAGSLQVHDLLRSCLTRTDDRALALRVAETYEALGDLKTALPLFLRSKNHVRIMEFLTTHGAELVESHDGAIEDAVWSYTDSRARKHPVVLALTAIRDTRRGDLDRAQTLLELAMSKAEDLGTKAAIAQSLAALLNNRGKPGAVEVLRDLRHADLPPRTHAEVLGALAAGCMIAGQVSHAREIVLEAVKEAERTTDDQLLAGTLQRASVVALHCADPALAEESARRAISLATEIGDDLIRSRALIALYAVRLGYHDDFAGAFEHLEQSVDAAEVAGDRRAAIFALSAAFAILVETGKLEAADRYERRIQAAAFPLGYQDAPHLTFARALRLAIAANFEGAVGLLASLPDERCSPAQRILRDSYRALFSVTVAAEDAAALLDLAVLDIRAAERGPLSLTDAHSVSLARVLAAFATSLLGGNADALRMLPKRRPVLNAASTGHLSDAVANIVRMRLHVAERPDERSAYEPIQGTLDGWSMCLAALVSGVRGSRRSSSCPLTPMQMTVLRELAKGNRSRDVAQMLGISVNTHANHVREIIKRLKCSGREEALRVARLRGYV
jgi:ATP/maltotriose-dependent transcriptional regulator MalT